MKTIFLALLTITMSTSLFAGSISTKDARLCKIFQEKSISYEKKMRDDVYAQKTLENYKNKTKLFCK